MPRVLGSPKLSTGFMPSGMSSESLYRRQRNVKRNNTHRKARPGQFDRVRRLVRSRFGDAVREALSNVGACLRQPHAGAAGPDASSTPATASLPSLSDHSIPLVTQAPRSEPPKWARQCLAVLVADVSGRIMKAQREMDRLTAAYAGLDHVPDSRAMPATPHGLVDPALEALAVRLATVMTTSNAEAYEHYARLVRAISPRPWDVDQRNPLGALVFARALVSCVADCLVTAEQRALLTPALLEDTAPHFLTAIVQTAEFMHEIGIKPTSGAIRFGYDADAEQGAASNAVPAAQRSGARASESNDSIARVAGSASRRKVAADMPAISTARQASNAEAADMATVTPAGVGAENRALAIAARSAPCAPWPVLRPTQWPLRTA